jgi:hypothetical protein
MNLKFYCFSLFLMLSVGSLLFAQKDPVKFGKISDLEMNMTVYDKDTSAPAVILFQNGELTFDYRDGIGFFIETTVHRRIKIL